MKTSILFSLLFLSIFLTSCDKEDTDPVSEITISNITLAESYSLGEVAQIGITIIKPTPCHEVEKETVTVSGKTYSYYFNLVNNSEVCIQVLARDETVSVDFEPIQSGEHILNFYINDKLFETRTVIVTE